MAIIDCVECGKQVSDKAAACPHCGNPMAAAAPKKVAPTIIETRNGGAVTTEATGKKFKIMEAIGAGIFLLGLVSCAYVGELLSPAPVSLIVIGSAIYILGGIGAWWNHG